MSSYFVQLSDNKNIVNLAHITDIEWTIEQDEHINPAYTSKINLTGGSFFYVTKHDARQLWDSLQRFNNRQLQMCRALTAISEFLIYPSNNPNNVPATSSANKQTNNKTSQHERQSNIPFAQVNSVKN